METQSTLWQTPGLRGPGLPPCLSQDSHLPKPCMQAWKLHYQFYTIRAESAESAVSQAVKMISANPSGFVIDAAPPDPAPHSFGGVMKAIATGK